MQTASQIAWTIAEEIARTAYQNGSTASTAMARVIARRMFPQFLNWNMKRLMEMVQEVQEVRDSWWSIDPDDGSEGRG